MVEKKWIIRFSNFKKALIQLEEGVLILKNRSLSNLEKQGLIQAFEFTFELAWKTLKDYLIAEGAVVKFPREIIKTAFQYDLLDNGDLWMEMLSKRNLLARTYNEQKANLAIEMITKSYFKQLTLLRDFFDNHSNDES